MTDSPRLDAAAWADALADHLPEGLAWPRDSASNLARVLRGQAPPFAALDVHAQALLEIEADPRLAQDMFGDWEAAFGLPDPCIPATSALNVRRIALVQRVTDLGGLSIARLIAIAAAIGFAVTIEEHRPARLGMRLGTRIYDAPWRFVWTVSAPQLSVRFGRLGTARLGDRLRDWDSTVLECVLRRLTPAHTSLLFNYGA